MRSLPNWQIRKGRKRDPAAPMTGPTRALSLAEFVALMAMLTATIAFSIDAILPALPQIGQDLSPESPNLVQMVVVAFVFGMGLGTLFAGPVSDAVGRKTVMLAGAVLYCMGAAFAVYAPSLESLLAARVLQGVGAAGPRVAAQAMIRDLYAGRGMARVSSFIMMTFSLVPAIAPLIGAVILSGFGWRGIFVSFVLFSLLSSAWLLLRQPETLQASIRRRLHLGRILGAAGEVLRDANVRRAILTQTLVYATLFATISSVQPVYDQTFGRADSFPYWFGLVAVVSAGASFLNASLVLRLGMLWLVRRSLAVHMGLSLLVVISWWTGLFPVSLAFALFVLWQIGSFSLAGLTIGNIQAIAMQPMGHIAGTAATVITATSTVVGVFLALPISLAFDGTPVPLGLGVGLCCALALWLARKLLEEPVELDDPLAGQKTR